MVSDTGPLPPELYLQPEVFARERRAIFAANWLPLGRLAAMPRAGDYICANLGGWPVFAIRDVGGAVAAFHNVCRHQGLPILDSGIGSCAALRCRYHGWTYDFGGGFVTAPPMAAPADPADALHRLRPVASAAWQDFLFLHLGAAPPPLAAAMQDAPLPSGVSFAAAVAIEVEANWKIVAEQLLAGEAKPGHRRFFLWPGLVIDASVESAVLHQIVARSFQRTHLSLHGHAVTEADLAAMAQSAKLGSEERQRRISAGADPGCGAGQNPAAFRDRVLSALR